VAKFQDRSRIGDQRQLIAEQLIAYGVREVDNRRRGLSVVDAVSLDRRAKSANLRPDN
jgi:hypothetical protein